MSGLATQERLPRQTFDAAKVGARIHEARRVAGLTQEELAEMASFSKRSLQDYETGVTLPYRQLREIGELLRRPVDWFLYGDDYAGSEPNQARVVDELRDLVERLEAIVLRLEPRVL